MIAALFVDPRGVYPSFPGVDCWDKTRDARKYAGPWAVIAHPPCERWGRYWSGGPSVKERKTLGDDGGCFKHALWAVRTFGGVLEHPEGSHAFGRFGLVRPRQKQGWISAGDGRGRVCCVAQGNYGHRARKLTWLYAVANEFPELDWSVPKGMARLDCGFHSAADRAARKHLVKITNRLTSFERLATPRKFAVVLKTIAESI